MTTEENKVSKYSIVNRIYAFFKGGDAAQWTKFMDRIIKKLTREIEGLEKNIASYQFNTKQQLDELDDKLEDAIQALEEAYLDVPVERISSNADQNVYIEVYIKNLEEKEALITRIENAQDNEKDTLKKLTEDCNKQIRIRKDRISKLTK